MSRAPSIPHLFRWGFPLFFFLTIFNTAVLSQGLSLTGKIRDTSANKDCADATVVLMQQDSVVIKQIRVGKDGRFVFMAVKPGEYIVRISYASLEEKILLTRIQAGKSTDLGIIYLTPKTTLLSTVIVTPKQVPPTIRGDTLEFNTAGIKLRENATVEDLLRRLPGVQVDAGGNIWVNGQKVDRILVNGEEFFANSPAIATRILNGDMIGKIQSFDQRSKESELTGVEDRQRTKTLNLSFNENSRNSLITKTELGAGDQGTYDANAIAASFKRSRQMALLGMASNTGNSGYNSTTGAMQAGLSVGLTTNDPLSTSAGTGIPRASAAGFHYANRWDGGDHLVGDYQVGHLLTRPFSSTRTIQNLPDSTYRQDQQNSSVNQQVQNAIKIDLDHTLDSFSSMRISVSGQDMQGQNHYGSFTTSYFNDTLVNNSARNVRSDVKDQYYRGGIYYTLHGKKQPRRKFSVFTSVSGHKNATTGYLFSPNSYFNPAGGVKSMDTTDQRKTFRTDEIAFGAGTSLTQPLWPGAVLAMKYAVSINENTARQSTFDRGNGKYQVFLDSLSTNFQSNVRSQTGTVNLQGKSRLFTYTVGAEVSQYTYRQHDLLRDSVFRLAYSGIAPIAEIRMNPSNSTSMSVGYFGTTQQPTLTQLQPSVSNNDPLHIVLGNPGLRPAFTHSFGVGFQQTKPMVVNVTIRMALTENEISNRVTTDSIGRQISAPVNVGGNYNTGIYISANQKVKSLDIDLGTTGNMTYTHANSYVNTELTHNNTLTTVAGLSIGKYAVDKFNLQINANVGYNYTESSINFQAPVQYWTQNHSVQLSIYPLRHMEINTFCGYSWRGKTSAFDKNTATVFCSAFLSESFLDSRLTIRGQVNNLFNQDAGISRLINGNQTTETHSNIIGRYFMLYASYKILSRH